MPENLPPPPNKPRGLVMIMLALFAMLLFAIIIIHGGLGTTHRTWSEFLDMVRSGKVAKVEANPDFAMVTTVVDPNTRKQETFRVLYPGARFEDTERQELKVAIEENNKRVEEQNKAGG